MIEPIFLLALLIALALACHAHAGIHLGQVAGAKKKLLLPYSSFDTHWHLIGGTGKGKTTALNTILQQLLSDPLNERCVIMLDRLGGFSWDLLMWMASPYCPQYVRDRLLYIEPARENVILGFNPLLYESPANGYYRVACSSELVLRGFANQDLPSMPRLSRWLFHAFWAAAQLGLTIADCYHLLTPEAPLHAALLGCLPPRLQSEWREITAGKNSQVVQLLESVRNRLRAFFYNPIMTATFGATRNRLDVRRFMREGRIVLINLAPQERLPSEIADAYAGLVLYEVLSTARSLAPLERRDTFLFLDEFQNFVGPDMAGAIPEVRQLKVKLIFSHQSFSQLKRGETDLSSLIFQCQSRMIFGLQGEDADLLGHEMASLHYDPNKIKDEIYARRQWLTGHRIVDLQSQSFTQSEAESFSRTIGAGWTRGQSGRIMNLDAVLSRNDSGSQSEATGQSHAHGTTIGTSQHLLPVHEEYWERVKTTYVTFDEDMRVWGRDIRRLLRGECFVRLVDENRAQLVEVERSVPGYLAWRREEINKYYPQADDALQELMERNFAQDFFCSPAQIERETKERLEGVLRQTIILPKAALPPANAIKPVDEPQRLLAKPDPFDV